MRVSVLVVLLAVLALLSGCETTMPQSAEGGDTVALGGEGDVAIETDALGEDEYEDETETTDLPACDPEPFSGGAECMVSGFADLDGDGTDECIMGFQERATDELGEPQGPAFFELAKWNGDQWGEWFGIPAPGGETFVDEASIAFAGDINDDGIAELGLQYYGFGVSSRPETLYVWQVQSGGVETAIEGGSVDTSSDDGCLVDDIDGNFPGQEIVFAIAQMGDEAHAAAHRYEVVLYGWSDGLYRLVGDSLLDEVFADPLDAIEAYELSQGD